jgi:L-alanine-DL-glutamate epimerase-like enolase superfamily enzyme
MKITSIRVLELRGLTEYQENYFEEDICHPVKIYPEHKVAMIWTAPDQEAARIWTPMQECEIEGYCRIKSYFVQIDTDEGVSGLAGPFRYENGFIISRLLKPHLIGHDPLSTERIWDRLYRLLSHIGRKGLVMEAISAVDCALWDLKGKWFGVPVYRLLGGATSNTIKSYAQMFGFSTDPILAQRRAHEMVARGFKAMKWFVHYGLTDGREGMSKNVELVRAVREAVGPDVDIMIDCWKSWDVPYTIEMARRIEEYDIGWIEDPILPDKIERYREIRRNIRIPIAAGEHEYTRWGFKALMDAQAVDILQPEPFWGGGITEVMKIITLATAYDLPVVLHCCSVPLSLHIIASQPVTTCPLLEYPIKWEEFSTQFFLRHPVRPVNGVVGLPTEPGLMTLAEEKIEDRRELFEF